MPRQPSVPIVGRPMRVVITMKSKTRTITEIHWYDGADNANDAQLLKDAEVLGRNRAKGLPNDCSVVSVTTSQENVFGDSYGTTNATWPASEVLLPLNESNDCIPVFMSGTTQYRRVMSYGLVPDDCITDDKFDLGASDAFKKWFTGYFALLTGKNPYLAPGDPQPAANNKWGFLARGESKVAYPVCDISVNGLTFVSGNDLFTVATEQNHGCAIGDVVQIKGVQGVNSQFPLNQLWVVNAVGAANLLTLQGFPPSVIPDPVPVSGGTLRKREKIFVKYDGYAPGQPSTRNRGVSKGAPKGRRKRHYNIGFPD